MPLVLLLQYLVRIYCIKEAPRERGKGCEKKVMDPAAAARRSNDINQVCRTGTKGVRCALYISIYQPVK